MAILKKILTALTLRPLINPYQNYVLTTKGLSNGVRRIKLLDNIKANALVVEKIRSNEPLMIARYGSIEFQCLVFEKTMLKIKMSALHNNAGFFPNDAKLMPKFIQTYKHASTQVDMLGVWNYQFSLLHWHAKKKLICQLPNITHLINLSIVSPYENEWVKALYNKKVLIIHPFKKSIDVQHQKRKELGILPALKSFKVIKAVQTLAGNSDERFNNWFEALEFMKAEISQEDFDICLIGCGAYGFPLTAHVKQLGKQAVHVGGSLQLLFGIKGKRWDERNIQYTKHWIRPLEEDSMKNKDLVEEGCYW